MTAAAPVETAATPRPKPKAGRVGDVVLTTQGLADAIGEDARGEKCSRKRAWGIMREIEQRYPGVVWRERGRREMAAWSSDLARYVPELRRKSPFEEALDLVLTRMEELERRIDAEVRTRQELAREVARVGAMVRAQKK